ncbi:MAG: DUF1194 domain-containing protein [Alphaproteobacteria bacterium]|nr:DUF1194 domain-containing protein [Alphaproteobacteria bacterium]
MRMPGWAILIFLLAITTARAEPVDLLLVLAVDTSESVSTDRYALQMKGYANAFRDPDVQQAITAGRHQRIAVAMMQWTGPEKQAPVIEWLAIHDAESADALARTIEKTPRKLNWGGTSIAGAIRYAAAWFDRAPMQGARKVIDISGDGANNDDTPVTEARDAAVKAGVTINGLPILWVEPGLEEHYRDEVIGGPGSFMIAIATYDQFAEAITRKLVTEIAAVPASPRLAVR